MSGEFHYFPVCIFAIFFPSMEKMANTSTTLALTVVVQAGTSIALTPLRAGSADKLVDFLPVV